MEILETSWLQFTPCAQVESREPGLNSYLPDLGPVARRGLPI